MRPSRLIHLAALALLIPALLATVGCQQPKQSPRPEVRGLSLGVAGFIQPRFDWQLLAGYIPDNRVLVENETLFDLDRRLVAELRTDPSRSFRGPAVTRQCQEIVVFEDKATRGAALDYWVKVGQCLPVDYLLVPQLIDWREREGGSMGVVRPAGVIFDLYVVDVKNHTMVSRYHFEEVQAALSENILELNKFLARGGKWLTAMELAKEGLRSGLDELRL